MLHGPLHGYGHLRTSLAAERGSFSAAARELGLTQPAVSQQIAGLERHLRTRLLNRSTRKLALTAMQGAHHASGDACTGADDLRRFPGDAHHHVLAGSLARDTARPRPDVAEAGCRRGRHFRSQRQPAR